MRTIKDPALLAAMLERHQIPSLFSTKDLDFTLLEYQPGEFLTSPNQETKRLLFLVQGTVAIRSIRSDGSEYLLTSDDRFSMLGDVEFVTGAPPSFWAQASTRILALGLSLETYQMILEQDVAFLHFLLHSLAEKLEASTKNEVQSDSLEDRLLKLMDLRCPDGVLTKIGETAALLHCSQRQLLRVLRRCTDSGILEKVGKGRYRRISF